MLLQLIELLKKNYLLLFVFMILALGRFSITDQGFLDDSDEVDYYAAEIAFEALIKGNFKEVSATLPLTEGKPTETFIKMLLVPLHRCYAAYINQQVYSQKALRFFGFYNIIVQLLLLGIVYSIFKNLKHSSTTSALGILLLGVFINYNIYARHLLSYDLGLLFFLTALLVFIKTPHQTTTRYHWVGFWAGLGFTTYHGYFLMLFILGGLIIWQQYFKKKKIMLSFFSFGQTFFGLILFYELIYALSGNSFLKDALKISGSINQGSFSEGFTFIFKYFYQVEGLIGILILIVGILYGIKFFFISSKKSLSEQILLLTFSAWLFYAITVFFLMKLVFYGRITHLFYPFIILAVLEFTKPVSKLKTPIITALVMVFCIQYYFNIQSLNSITYPRKVLDEFGLFDKHAKDVKMNFIAELGYSENYVHDPRNILLGNIPNTLKAGNYDIINTCFFDHHPDRFIDKYSPYLLPKDSLIFSKLHFMSYPAYTFEYCSNKGRSFYIEKKIKISIVKK